MILKVGAVTHLKTSTALLSSMTSFCGVYCKYELAGYEFRRHTISTTEFVWSSVVGWACV
jgi:hypothetical protein